MSAETNELARNVHDLGLEVFPGYFGLSEEQQELGWNGVGPDSWPAWKREVLTFLTPMLRPGSFLHDLEATHANDGTRLGFEEWNARFNRNNLRTIRGEVAWWRILKRRALYAEATFALSQVSGEKGWVAWLAAYEKNQQEGPETELRSGAGESTFVEGMEDSA